MKPRKKQNIMDLVFKNTDSNTVGYYWNALRSLSKNIRLALAVKLTNSVLEEESTATTEQEKTQAMLTKFYGKWTGDETPEELMGIIKEHTSTRTPLNFDQL